jgi:hypothetical protein
MKDLYFDRGQGAVLGRGSQSFSSRSDFILIKPRAYRIFKANFGVKKTNTFREETPYLCLLVF